MGSVLAVVWLFVGETGRVLEFGRAKFTTQKADTLDKFFGSQNAMKSGTQQNNKNPDPQKRDGEKAKIELIKPFTNWRNKAI